MLLLTDLSAPYPEILQNNDTLQSGPPPGSVSGPRSTRPGTFPRHDPDASMAAAEVLGIILHTLAPSTTVSQCVDLAFRLIAALPDRTNDDVLRLATRAYRTLEEQGSAARLGGALVPGKPTAKTLRLVCAGIHELGTAASRRRIHRLLAQDLGGADRQTA